MPRGEFGAQVCVRVCFSIISMLILLGPKVENPLMTEYSNNICSSQILLRV